VAGPPFRNLEKGCQRCLHRFVHFGLLGPLEVLDEGQPVPVGGPKQRALLALLLLRANEPVSRDLLIDEIWGGRLPQSPGQALDTYVSRLRKLLGPDRLVRGGGGCMLRVESGELDLDRFERLVAAGAFREALEIWRGPALADLRNEPGLTLEAARLEERRLDVIEERVDRDLTNGGGPELVGELEQLVREHPLRERLRAALMLALYRAGRQAAALEAYRSARRTLADELGLEPGPQLQELERRILAHDPSLITAVPDRESQKTGRFRLQLAAGVALLAVGATAAGIVVATRGHGQTRDLLDQTSRLLAIKTSSPTPSLMTGLPGSPAAIASAAGAIWLADPSDDLVLRADPVSGSIVDRIAVHGEPGAIAAGGGSIWVAGTISRSVQRIDPATDAVTQTVPLGGGNTSAIAFGRGRLWVADTSDGALVEIDPGTGAVERTFTLDLHPTALAVGHTAVWVADYDAGRVSEVDPSSGQTLATIPVGNGPAALTFAAGSLWVANSLDSTVTAIDTDTSSIVATIPVGSGPSSLAAAQGSVWVANQYSGTVSRIEPRRKIVTATLRTGGEPAAVVPAAGLVWVGAGASAASHRGGTLRLVGTRPFDTIDPALQFVTAFQFSRFTYDTLVTFAAATGPAGLRLVPDLALAVPVPAGGGTVYTFLLRPGIRYSDGRLLRAEDFRRAIERQFRLDGPVTDYFKGIVGAVKCTRAHCDLSQGIDTDDRTGTVTFRLARPDPDFLYKLAVEGFSAPVPPGTPDHDVGFAAVPGTGPYRIAQASRHEIRFVRNRLFTEWSHAAQPDGNPDRIVWRFPSSLALATREVERGQADWVVTVAPSQLARLRVQHPGQLHLNPTFGVEFVSLNTHRPPFDDVRVRRALNYAIDRARIARMYGGRPLATPLCQPLTPGFPAYRRYCPYTQNPRASGVWSAPDLAKARQLVAASGTQGEHVTLWGSPDEGFIPRELPAYIASVLRSLGYRTTLHLVPLASMTSEIWRRIQIAADGDWLPDYPTPSSYLPGFFGCHGALGNGAVCDPKLDRQMRQASDVQLRDPRRAAALWTRIDQELTDRAYWVPTVSLGAAELVSRRLGNYQFNPFGDFIADQAWLR
jgi:YVTN family beta-propeller protein